MATTLVRGRDRREVLEPDSARQAAPRSTPKADRASLAASTANMQFRWLILTGLVLAAALEVLDTTVVNVALPQMAGNLGTTTQEIAWVSTAYIMANVIVLPMTAFLNSFFGRRNYLAGSIILFTIASFFCGTSHSLGEIISWRIIQGAGGAALMSTAQAALVQVFPPKEQAIVQPAFMMGLVVFPTLGPTIGGWVTNTLAWNWCFFVNIPIGIIAGMLVFFLLHDTEAAKRDEPADWIGIGLLAAGLGSLQFVLEEGQQNDWFASLLITRMTILCGVSLAGMVAWLLSARNRHPIVNLRVLKNRSVSGGMIIFMTIGLGLYGVNYLYPIMAQTLQGLSPLQTGLAMLPGGMASAASVVFCGVLVGRRLMDLRLLTLAGFLLFCFSMWKFAHLNAQSSTPETFSLLIMRGLSTGLMFVPINSLAIQGMKPKEVNEGISLLGLGRQLGGSVGIAILTTVLANCQQFNRANLVGDLTPSNPAYDERLSGLIEKLISSGYSPADAPHVALGIINQILTGQVLTMSFNATFLVLMLISAAMIPALLLMKQPSDGAAASSPAI